MQTVVPKAEVLAGRAAERRGQGRAGICNRGGGGCEYREGGLGWVRAMCQGQ